MPVEREGMPQVLYTQKPLDVTSGDDLKAKVKDVEFFGDPDAWVLIGKAWSESQGWMKSTKAMAVGMGVLVQVTTERTDATGHTALAEALTYVPSARIVVNEADGTRRLE